MLKMEQSNILLDGKESARLRFRKVLEEDFPKWLPFYDDPSSTEFWDGLSENPLEACQQQFDRIFERYQNNLGGMNALISKETNELVGFCGLLTQTVDSIEELEIGYSLLPRYRRKGLATEAAQRCKLHAQENNLARSLISIIHVDNLPSQKVAVNNGMFLDKTTTYKQNPVHIFRVIL